MFHVSTASPVKPCTGTTEGCLLVNNENNTLKIFVVKTSYHKLLFPVAT